MTTLTLLPDPASPLDHETAHAAFEDILDGRVADDAIARFLIGLAERDETSIEIAAAARALRARMVAIAAPAGAIDVCGTGGDGAHSLNISTTVAIVVAACGVPVGATALALDDCAITGDAAQANSAAPASRRALMILSRSAGSYALARLIVLYE